MKEKKQVWANIKPVLVLVVFLVVAAGAIAAVYRLTYSDDIMTVALKKASEQVFPDGYTLVEKDGEALTYENVNAVILSKDGKTAAFDVSATGYSKNGVRVLVAVRDNTVAGIAVVELGETAGIGDRINDAEYLEKYTGADSSAVDGVDAITGATYTSRGLKTAIQTALDTYSAHKEEIFSGKTE